MPALSVELEEILQDSSVSEKTMAYLLELANHLTAPEAIKLAENLRHLKAEEAAKALDDFFADIRAKDKALIEKITEILDEARQNIEAQQQNLVPLIQSVIVAMTWRAKGHHLSAQEMKILNCIIAIHTLLQNKELVSEINDLHQIAQKVQAGQLTPESNKKEIDQFVVRTNVIRKDVRVVNGIRAYSFLLAEKDSSPMLLLPTGIFHIFTGLGLALEICGGLQLKNNSYGINAMTYKNAVGERLQPINEINPNSVQPLLPNSRA